MKMIFQDLQFILNKQLKTLKTNKIQLVLESNVYYNEMIIRTIKL